MMNGQANDFKDSNNADFSHLENTNPIPIMNSGRDRESVRDYEYKKPLDLGSEFDVGNTPDDPEPQYENPSNIEHETLYKYNQQDQVDNLKLHPAPAYQHLHGTHSKDKPEYEYNSAIDQEDPPSEVVFYKKWYQYLTGGASTCLSMPGNYSLIGLFLSVIVLR